MSQAGARGPAAGPPKPQPGSAESPKATQGAPRPGSPPSPPAAGGSAAGAKPAPARPAQAAIAPRPPALSSAQLTPEKNAAVDGPTTPRADPPVRADGTPPAPPKVAANSQVQAAPSPPSPPAPAVGAARAKSATLPLILERAAPAAAAAPAVSRPQPPAASAVTDRGVAAADRSGAAADRLGPVADRPVAVSPERTAVLAGTPPVISNAANGAKTSEEDATVVARSPGLKSGEAVSPPPLPASYAAGGDELRSQIRTMIEEAVGPWQHALQNQQRTVLELLQRLEDIERRIPSAARAVVGVGLPNLAPTSMPPFPSASPVGTALAHPTAAASAAAGANPVVDLTSADQRILAALEGRSRRRHLVLTAVLVVVLLFGGLGIALALSYMPHPH